jgi:arylsulfatase A-like enzyme
MKRQMKRMSVALTFVLMCTAAVHPALAGPASKHNLVVFVPDGLRYDAVNEKSAPTFAEIRKNGVDFSNSHSSVPTLTTVNAAVIATGHYPGDTGNYGNTLDFGRPIPCAMNAEVTFIEDDCILRDVKAAFPNDYLAQETLIQAARKAGYNTVVVGKLGPAAIQFLPALDSKNNDVEGPLGIFIDDATGHPTNQSGQPTKSTALTGAIANEALSATGVGTTPFPSKPNLTQQAYEQSVVAQVLIPRLKTSGKPFVLFFWSRDPDTTQHGAEDSDGKLIPGINSVNPYAAVYNADTTLKNILGALELNGLKADTNIIVAADHGFSTVAKGIPTDDGHMGPIGLPPGFLAVDIARWLNAKLFDPDRANAEVDIKNGEKPTQSNGLVGDTAATPKVRVVSNGGVDYLYLPESPDRVAAAKMLIAHLIEAPYVGGLFVNDALLKGHEADFAGALPMSEIRLIGSSKLPQPAIVVAFRSFVVNGCALGDLLCTAAIYDTGYHTGQGMHGSLSRADTRNFMAAMGPDFQAGVKIDTPVGNVDIAPTAARLLGVSLSGPGTLKGRVVEEALIGGKPPTVAKRRIESAKAANGVQTVLDVQDVSGVRYIDAGGIPGRVVGLQTQ